MCNKCNNNQSSYQSYHHKRKHHHSDESCEPKRTCHVEMKNVCKSKDVVDYVEKCREVKRVEYEMVPVIKYDVEVYREPILKRKCVNEKVPVCKCTDKRRCRC